MNVSVSVKSWSDVHFIEYSVPLSSTQLIPDGYAVIGIMTPTGPGFIQLQLLEEGASSWRGILVEGSADISNAGISQINRVISSGSNLRIENDDPANPHTVWVWYQEYS